ncbi:MAG: hypothetical protein A2X77_04585 [Gammaproteobacteria bacterium GWE2_42_36]|nr:MAG: hypothetical protein A2X77_04585 [Gammaproteobacteria bacterium GWE2_42_36]
MLQTKQGSIGIDSNYVDTIEKAIKAEIIPAAKNFKKKLQTIDERFVGSLAKSALTWLSGGSIISVFSDLSWEKIIALSSPVSACVLKNWIDNFLSTRAIRRECSISYILSLDN